MQHGNTREPEGLCVRTVQTLYSASVGALQTINMFVYT